MTLQPVLRLSAAAAVCLGLWLITAGMAAAATIDDGRAAANLSRLGDSPVTTLPILLRGSAIGPKPATPRAAAVADRIRIGGGRRLWTVHQAAGEVRSCSLHRTTRVGVRVVRCVAGRTDPHHRGFGRTFHP